VYDDFCMKASGSH